MKTLQEDLKVFYLGLKDNEPFLYKNHDLTTHAMIVGMSGSGKTGLGLSLLEEACIDSIPSIIIDPKGDLANLALSFSSTQDFMDFENCDESRAGELLNSLKTGLESSFQSLERVELVKKGANVRVFTPKSSVGLGISVLSSLSVPTGLDDESLQSYILGLTQNILALISLSASSSERESVLIQNILHALYESGQSFDLATLTQSIITPPFSKIGVLSLESFYPANERKKLATRLNSLLANPSFSAWMRGQSLDIASLLFDSSGKAQANIFSIAHLSDDERMFFTTTLLNALLSWMRQNDGSSALRAIFYMDEIYGYFPPNANPPSKEPMMTLLKQARAFGLGCVLSTQNPADIDYKGLGNISTWFVGRLQTSRDKERLLEGLVGLGGADKNEVLGMLEALEKREFVLKNANDNSLTKIKTRHALSYLKGPLNKEQLKWIKERDFGTSSGSHHSDDNSSTSSQNAQKPVLALEQFYENLGNSSLRSYLYARAKVDFSDTSGARFSRDCAYLLGVSNELCWSNAQSQSLVALNAQPPQDASYSDICEQVLKAKDEKELIKGFKDFLYRNERAFSYCALGLKSKLGESKEAFFGTLAARANELLETKTHEILVKFRAKESLLNSKLSRAEAKVAKEQNDLKSSGLNTAIGIGVALFGALFGGRSSTSKIASGVRSASRTLKEHSELKSASEQKELILNEIENLKDDFKEQIATLKAQYNPALIEITTKEIAPKKSDIYDEKIVLVWR